MLSHRSSLALGALLMTAAACGSHPSAASHAAVPTPSAVKAASDTSGSSSGNPFLPPTTTGTTPVVSPPVVQDCNVDASRELVINALDVVEDPTRTQWTGGTSQPSDGAWSFGRILTNMAGTTDPSAFVESWLKLWEVDQTVNGFTVPARRSGVDENILDIWPRRADGSLDLTQSPMRLLAITNRLDLRQPNSGSAGELRFVFGLTDPQGLPQLFTAILEFNMPITANRDALAWATLWHNVKSATDTESYNQALETVTDLVTQAHSDPSQANGSAIFRIRTNEIALDTFNSPPLWELRQFQIDAAGAFAQVGVGMTPDLTLNKTAAFAAFVNQNTSGILAGDYSVPATFNGTNFLAGSSINAPFQLITPLQPAVLRDPNTAAVNVPAAVSQWTASGITNNDARVIVSLNTCNGCHGVETITQFTHISPRAKGQPAALSGFLTGESVSDPVDPNTTRTYSDMQRRADDMSQVLCHGAGTSNGSGIVAMPSGL